MHAAPPDTNQLAPAHQTQVRMLSIDHCAPPIEVQRSKALAKKISLDNELANLYLERLELAIPPIWEELIHKKS